MKNKLMRTALAVAIAATMSVGLTACGSDSGSSSDKASSESKDAGAKNESGESEAFVNDMKEGVKIINDKIAEEPGMTQIMLASDVDQPTEKYGMWVMPYYPSDAVKKYTMSIQIEDGTKFVVTCVSAETEKTWEMDQDGNMTEKTK
ncbi:hypothetical protein I6E29_07070 [Arcanobacterium haemolyticum]|nr:hypothetical protein [Arcanobacterium haemolyticum]